MGRQPTSASKKKRYRTADRQIGFVALGVVMALGLIARVAGQHGSNEAAHTSRQAAEPTVVRINEQPDR
jgi:hypothetical protein